MATIKAGATTFLRLTDTPSSYAGAGSQGVRVNAGASGLEFYTVVDTDEKAKVSSNDTTSGYLNGKLVAGANIVLTELNDGLNETLSIAATVPAESDPLSLHLDQTVQQTVINNGILVAPDTAVASTLGRWKFGYVGDPLWVDYPILAHYDAFNTTDYALSQDPGGWTYLNCAAISNIDFCVGGAPLIRLNAGGFSVEAQPILFGRVGSEDIEIQRLGVQNLGIFSDYGDVDLDLAGAITATSTVIGKQLATPVQSKTLGVGITTFALTSNVVILTGDAGGNTLATITDGVAGQFLKIICADALVIITNTDTHAANTIDLSAAFTSADDTVLTLVFDGISWYETSRSAN